MDFQYGPSSMKLIMTWSQSSEYVLLSVHFTRLQIHIHVFKIARKM